MVTQTSRSRELYEFTFTVDGYTPAIIHQLQNDFGVDEPVDVFRRALALAWLFAQHQRDDHTITLIGRDEKQVTVFLRG
jgi:hypothetical protein